MAEYLAEFPNYKVHVRHALQGGSGVVIIGKTTGSDVPPEIEEGETLVWTTEAKDGLIGEWRVYSGEEYARRS